MILSLEELKQCQEGPPGDPWAALELLDAHLDDHLVSVASVQFVGQAPSSLTVFLARDERETPLFVLVSSEGDVTLGRVDHIEDHVSGRLAGFNSLEHGVVSVSVTDRHRFAGKRSDLWIVVRRTSATEDQTVAYHGVVGLEEEQLVLEAALDDRTPSDERRWEAVDAARLPEWLRAWSFMAAPGADPFDAPFLHVLGGVQSLEESVPGDIEAVACSLTAFAIAAGDEVRLWRTGNPSALSFSTGDWVRALALSGAANSPRGVAGPDARLLVGFEADADSLREVWRQPVAEFPVAVAFLPLHSKTPPPWPDLLVAFSNGELKRLRYFGSAAFRAVSEAVWTRTGATTAAARIEAAAASTGRNSGQRSAAIRGAVLKALGEAPSVAPEVRGLWLTRIAALFRPEERSSVLMGAVQLLLDSLQDLVMEQRPPWPLGEDGSVDFVAALLHTIYQGKAYIAIQDEIDQTLRMLRPAEEHLHGSELAELDRRSKHNREAVWAEKEPSDDEGRIRRTVFGLERWASAYLHADIARLPRWGGTATVTGLAGLPREGVTPQTPWLVAGQGKEIQVIGFTEFGTLNTPPGNARDLSPDAIRTILHLPATSSVLVAGASGTLYLLRVDPATGVISEVDRLDVTGLGSPWAMAACTPPGGVPRVALSFNDRRRSSLVMLAVEGRLRELGRQPLDLPRVRALDLAEDGKGGLLLALSSIHAAPIVLCRCDEAGAISERRSFRALQSGTLAIRFSSSSRPAFLLAGERRGLLWCADLREESEVSDLRWTYDLGAAIRALEIVESQGEAAFLAGAEQGRLVLLRARDGRRLWKHRLRAPVRVIRQIYTGAVAVSLQGGTVVALDRVEDRPVVLAKVEGYLRELRKSTGGTSLRAANAEPVLALSRLIESHSLVSVLRDVPVREIRARLVRYLAEVIGPDLLEDEIGDVLQEFSLREVQLLLSYLPDEVVAWDEAILRDLKRRELGTGTGGDSRRAGMAAWATLVQRLGRGSPSLDALRQSCPPAEYCELPWVKLEVARLLVRLAAADLGSANRLLGKALELLIEMPFSILAACPAVLRYGSQDARDFYALRTVADDLLRCGLSRLDDIETLADALESSALPEGLLSLVAAIARLSAIRSKYQDQGSPWIEYRTAVLDVIRRICDMLQGLKGIEVPLGALAEALRPSLPSDPPPQDDESLQRRAAWLQQARHRLEAGSQHQQQPEGGDDPWAQVAHELALGGWKAILTAVTHEIAFVNQLVRPFLELRDISRGEGHWLELRLTARPEGGRTLADVSILFDVEGDEGLRPPGELKDRLDVLKYPDRTVTKELVFRGYVRPEQRIVVVRVQVEDGEDYTYKESWSFRVPPSLDRIRHRLTFPEQLPKLFQTFVEAVVAADSPVVFAVLDEDLGRENLIKSWLGQTGGQRVNLDEVVREIGPGRRYAARSLDLELLTAPLAPPEGMEGAPPTVRPILVAPVSELLQRLLDGEVDGLLKAWLSLFEARISAGCSPQWVFAVPADQACRLRALHEGRIPEVAAHRTLLTQLGPDRRRPSPLFEEACTMVAREMHVTEEIALGRLQALGWDLRLVFRWLRWSRDAAGRDISTPHAFLIHPPTRQLLDLELAALGPLELVRALVGAEIVTILDRAQVQPGHYAAEDYRSTTRKSTPKLLQGRGTPFDEKSLGSLQADQAPPVLVRIEGIGLAGTQDRGRTALGQLANHGRREEREATFRHLADRGIGSYTPPVFRTGTPYRELIRGLYDLKATLPEAKRDGAVYAAIKGRGRSPLESLSVAAIGSLSREDLKSLLPDASGDELRRLRKICQLWGPQGADEDGEDVESVLRSLFQGDPLTRLTTRPEDHPWRAPLARLPWPVFGIGKEVDEFYIWSGRDSPVDLASIGDAVEQAGRLRHKEETEKERMAAGTEEETPTQFRDLKVTILGPGADLLAYDETRRVAILRAADLLQAAWEGSLADGIRRRTRSQMRITALSPFKTSGALPPRSPLFVGREKELAFIKNRIRAASILVIGSRRVGKTSLLNQIDGWAQEEPDLSPIFVDLQGCSTETDFMARLDAAARERGYAVGENFSLASLTEQIRKSGRLPVFLLNEIDGLVHKAPEFVSSWRGYNDLARARFVMVGYTAIGTLGHADAALFHFTEGTALAGKALVLTALSTEAGEKLLDLLESQDLGIRWATPEDRTQAYRLCLDRSYQIPWVLQRYGQMLVEHLEAERRDTLTYAAVERVIEHEGRVVWQYINGIEYQRLGAGVTNAQRPGFQLILSSVARQRYFLGGRDAPIRDPGLPGREGLDLGFTIGEAREIVKETLRELLIQRREREVVERWFDGLDLEQAFPLLTLTLMLEPDPKRDDRFGFLLHILPRELQRSYGKVDPTLDDLIIRQAVEFMSFMQIQRGE